MVTSSTIRLIHHRPRSVALAVGLFLLLPHLLPAQQLSGRLQRHGTNEPLSGALVILLDSVGHEVTRTVSSASGGFAVAASHPGRFQLRVLRIGATPWTTAPIQLSLNERREVRLALDDTPVQLAEIDIRAAGSRCGIRPGDSDVMARLLTEAEKALAIAVETIRDAQHLFRTQTWIVRPDREGVPGEREFRTVFGLATWPVQSAPPESLAVWGFVHDGPPYGTPRELVTEMGPVYYGPDARVLFADWFLDKHCFTVAVDSTDEGRYLLVRFVPLRGNRGVDISGTLRLHRETLELRTLTFRYTGLGRWMPPDSSGGELSFRRLRTGALIIDRWNLRAPIPVLRPGREPGFFGFAESGGRVIEVRHGRDGVPEVLSFNSSLWRSDL